MTFMSRSILVVGLVSLLAGGCGEQSPSNGSSEKQSPSASVADLRPFRIGIYTWIGYGPFYIAKEKGFFAEEGLDVDIQKIENDGTRRSALIAHELDGAIELVDQFANAAPNGLPAQVVLKLDDSVGGDGILGGPGVKTVSGLKGKTIAFQKGTPSHYLLHNALSQAGLGIKDIEPFHMEASEAAVALMGGKVDAAVTWEPWLSRASKEKGVTVLFDSGKVPGLIVDIFVVHRDVLSQRHEDVLALARGWFKAVTFWRDHPDEANAIMAKGLEIKPEDLAAVLPKVKYTDLEGNLDFFGLAPGSTDQFSPGFEKAESFWLEEGLIKSKVLPADYIGAAVLKDLAR